MKVAGATLLVAGENPWPPALNDNPAIISNVLIKEMEFKNNCFFFTLLSHKLTDSWINGLIDGLTDCLID